MVDAPFVPSVEEARTLHQVRLATEIIKVARPREQEPFWRSEKIFGIVGVFLGGILAMLGGRCTQSAAYRERQDDRKFAQVEEARKERLEVALQVQRQVGAALAGCDKLTIVAAGRFDGDVAGGRSMTDAANQATESWRRESEALDLSLRLHYGEKAAPVGHWRVVREKVDDYIAGAEAFYMDWRAGTFSKNRTAQAERTTLCDNKRKAVLEGLAAFGLSLRSEAVLPSGVSRVGRPPEAST